MTIRAMALMLGAALLTACPGYSPEFTDCKVKCSDKGACPQGRECKQGFCRPPGVMTNCDCTPGAQRACGGGVGECTSGIQSCTNAGSWGQCLGEGKPSNEVCDNKDNDCNGSIDDDVMQPMPCPKTMGVCAKTFQKCVGGSYSGTCVDADYGPNYETIETRCDNADNDCDGVVDATRPSVLLSNVVDFVLAEFDGGFSIVGVEEKPTLDGGGPEYQVVMVRLGPTLLSRGPVVPVSPPAQPGYLHIAARATAAGTTFVAWSAREVDAGVSLSAIDSNGIVSQFPSYLNSEKAGELSLGVNASKVLVTWLARFTQVARLVTWDLNDGGVVAKDYGLRPDGGFNGSLNFYTSRLSHTGKVLGTRGYDNDGGVNFDSVVELQGPRSSTASLGGKYGFVEVGNTVSWASHYSFFGISFPFILPARSGLAYKADTFSSGFSVALKEQPDQNLTYGGIGRGQNTPVVVWVEKNLTAVIAVPYGTGQQTRQRFLPSDGGYLADVQLGHPGGASPFIGVVWRDTLSGPGNVNGMMACQP